MSPALYMLNYSAMDWYLDLAHDTIPCNYHIVVPCCQGILAFRMQVKSNTVFSGKETMGMVEHEPPFCESVKEVSFCLVKHLAKMFYSLYNPAILLD